LFRFLQQLATHHAELTALERDDHVAEWIRLSDNLQSSQSATNENARHLHGHNGDAGLTLGQIAHAGSSSFG